MTSDMSPGSDIQANFPNAHPSAKPLPLRFGQQSSGPVTVGADDEDLRNPLPAGQTLDAYLVLHNHIDQSQWAIQEGVIRETGTIQKKAVSMHEENLKQMRVMYSDVVDKVKALEDENIRTSEGVHNYKAEVISAIETLSSAMQKNLVKPMDKLFHMNTALMEKVDSLYTRLDDLEKHTKANSDAQQQSLTGGSRFGMVYSPPALDGTTANPYDNHVLQQQQSPSWAGGPPRLNHPSTVYYSAYGGQGHPTNYSSGSYVFQNGASKDADRGQRQPLFTPYGDAQMQANGGAMQQPASRFNNSNIGNGHGQN